MDLQKLVILDYSTKTVHNYYVRGDTEVDYNFIIDLGFKLDNIEWMVGNGITTIDHMKIIM